MRNPWPLLLTLGSWLVACGGTPESSVDGRIAGTRNGGPVDISFHFINGGEGGLVYGGFLEEDHSRMKLGEVDYACKGEKGLLQCFADVPGIEVDGCRWRAVVLTDGSVDQFALAGFADSACAQHTCNTWR